MPVVSSLFVYPIKSCRGSSLKELEFDEHGPRWDRRWMLVDSQGTFISQRTQPRLARVEPKIVADGLTVNAPGLEPLSIASGDAPLTRVRIWDFEGLAADEGDLAAAWFERAIGAPCRLMRLVPETDRKTSTRYSKRESQVGFSDGYPALMCSLESLAELNRKLEQPLPMNRFRPNLVVRDCQPFEEDEWTTLRAPELTLDVVKPCERCVITTIDQQSLTQSKEPLATLASFRKGAGFVGEDAGGRGVTFGQNCIHHAPGWLRVGDELEVVSRRELTGA
ncbi:MAG TPA: MOSC N-terminal beta barrel domain-containing protein [Polyangiaceae bacterium]|jgi:hypothetical protein|nr:MOSC N-terminal beta barrel domain-containing protein [Polyangiaceae bacterium]